MDTGKKIVVSLKCKDETLELDASGPLFQETLAFEDLRRLFPNGGVVKVEFSVAVVRAIAQLWTDPNHVLDWWHKSPDELVRAIRWLGISPITLIEIYCDGCSAVDMILRVQMVRAMLEDHECLEYFSHYHARILGMSLTDQKRHVQVTSLLTSPVSEDSSGVQYIEISHSGSLFCTYGEGVSGRDVLTCWQSSNARVSKVYEQQGQSMRILGEDMFATQNEEGLIEVYRVAHNDDKASITRLSSWVVDNACLAAACPTTGCLLTADGRLWSTHGANINNVDASNVDQELGSIMALATNRRFKYAAFSADGQRVFASLGDDRMHCFDLSGMLTDMCCSFVMPKGFKIVRHIKLSPDGRWIAVAGSSHVVVWKVDEPHVPTILRQLHRGCRHSVAFSPNSRWVLAGQDILAPREERTSQLCLWRVENMDSAPLLTVDSPAAGFNDISWNSDGEVVTLVTGEAIFQHHFYPQMCCLKGAFIPPFQS